MTTTATTTNGATDTGSRVPALQDELSRASLAVAEATAALKRAQHEQRAAQAGLMKGD